MREQKWWKGWDIEFQERDRKSWVAWVDAFEFKAFQEPGKYWRP